MKITIDEEFRSLLPRLNNETYSLLEENLLKNGCRDSLILWGDVLIDGYNRFEICTRHDIPFNTVEKTFDSREDVLIWIITNQVSRRNLTPMQLSHFRGLHYKAEKRIQGTNNRYVQRNKKLHNAVFYGSTAKRLAEQYNVSDDTILRDVKVSDAIEAIGEISPDAKMKILSSEAKIDKKELGELSSKTREEIKVTAAEIDSGAYNKRRPVAQATAELGEPVRLIIAGMRSLNSVIKKGDISELKPALRTHIDMLEGMYQQI